MGRKSPLDDIVLESLNQVVLFSLLIKKIAKKNFKNIKLDELTEFVIEIILSGFNQSFFI
jgi:hypothetical protein